MSFSLWLHFGFRWARLEAIGETGYITNSPLFLSARAKMRFTSTFMTVVFAGGAICVPTVQPKDATAIDTLNGNPKNSLGGYLTTRIGSTSTTSTCVEPAITTSDAESTTVASGHPTIAASSLTSPCTKCSIRATESTTITSCNPTLTTSTLTSPCTKSTSTTESTTITSCCPTITTSSSTSPCIEPAASTAVSTTFASRYPTTSASSYPATSRSTNPSTKSVTSATAYTLSVSGYPTTSASTSGYPTSSRSTTTSATSASSAVSTTSDSGYQHSSTSSHLHSSSIRSSRPYTDSTILSISYPIYSPSSCRTTSAVGNPTSSSGVASSLVSSANRPPPSIIGGAKSVLSYSVSTGGLPSNLAPPNRGTPTPLSATGAASSINIPVGIVLAIMAVLSS